MSAENLTLLRAFNTLLTQGNIDAVSTMIEAHPDFVNVDLRYSGCETPLCMASMHDHAGIVELLLKAGADVHAVNHYGNTPLHMAAIPGHVDVAQLLIKHGADVHAVNYNGDEPLHIAAQCGREDIAQLLIDKGADVHAVGHYGYTLLHIASQYGRVDVAKLLIEKGADVHAVNYDGDEPLHMASKSLNCNLALVKLLLGNYEAIVEPAAAEQVAPAAEEAELAGVVVQNPDAE